MHLAPSERGRRHPAIQFRVGVRTHLNRGSSETRPTQYRALQNLALAWLRIPPERTPRPARIRAGEKRDRPRLIHPNSPNGNLAQLVEQRTLKTSYKIDSTH